MSAADVLFTFDLLKQKGRPQQRDAFGRVKRAEALDLMTVRFDLSGLDSEMPLALAMMPVLPKHGTDVEHFDDPTHKQTVWTGPYVIADVQPGKRLILRRNPDYWAQDLPVQRGLFNFDEIEIDYYRDADSSFEAFKAGLPRFSPGDRRWALDKLLRFSCRAGRPHRQGKSALWLAKGNGGLRLQHAAVDIC